MPFSAAALDTLDSQLAILDADGNILYVNQCWLEFARANGMPPGYQFVGTSYLNTCFQSAQAGAVDSQWVGDGIAAVISGRLPKFEHEYPCDSPDEKRWFVVRIAGMRGHPGKFVVAHHNTTQRKLKILASEQALRESMLHAQAVLENIADGVITIDELGAIQTFNRAATQIFGYTADEAVSRDVSMLMTEPSRVAHDGYLARYVNTRTPRVQGGQLIVEGLRKNGQCFPMSMSISEVAQGQRITLIGVVRDLSQQKKDEERIRQLAFYDPLTNLPNRRLLIDHLRHALETSKRSEHHRALIFLDLDHFKVINDSLGHDVGDDLLKQVGLRLVANVREGDIVARLGGDEFVVVLEGLHTQELEAAAQVEAIAQKLLDVLGQEYVLQQHSYISTPSIGVAMFQNSNESPEDLIKKADLAMYQAKSAGRNTLRFFDPLMQAAVNTYLELESDIRGGLAQHEFLLHFQPQVDPQGRCSGFEALVRWRHPVRGMVSPAQFIPLAEETGTILPLGFWILEEACRQLVCWASHTETAHWTVAVNVSARQFAQRNFVEQIAQALASTGAPPERLKLELTESMLVTDIESIVGKMNAVRAMGVRFSLDDFGTGYSSLTYLKRLPLSQLKVDQSFVRDVITDPNDAVIVRTILALGHSLGLSVIAEGVETQEQLDFLLSIGCDAFQGYYFGRPAPVEQLSAAHVRLQQ